MSILDLGRHYPEALGIDARIYFRAAEAYRLGGDPWAAFVANPPGDRFHFAALPPTVLAFLPLTGLPERLAVWLVVWLGLLSAVYIVKKLGLPMWWLLFPPLTQGVYAGNPQIVLLAALLSGISGVVALAPMLKIYALAPLVGERWIRALLFATIYLAISVVIAPTLWASYVEQSGAIATRLLDEARGGYAGTGNSIPLTAVGAIGVAALSIVDLRAAGWLVSPALVPASQFHLSTMAMPVLANAGAFGLTIALALPVQGLPTAAIGVYGVWRCYEAVRSRRVTGDTPGMRPGL